MRVDPRIQRRLLDLASVDSAIRNAKVDLNKATSGSAQDIQSEKATVAGELRDQLAIVDGIKVELRKVEDDIATAQSRIERDKNLLATATEAKDISVLSAEMDKLAERIDALETKEIEMLDTKAEAEAKLAEVQAKYEALGNEITSFESEQNEKILVAKKELDELLENRKIIESEFPEELLALYNKQLERYGVGASELVGSVTSATGISIPATELAKIRATSPEEIVLCPDSNAILVR
ncbi:MAG: hypothetical protein KF916_03530 [Microbacteriaceae bacterium]|nr:hypothetical protein [Microbacteriaceae bacterium]